MGDVEWAMRNNRSLAGQNFWAYTGLGRPDKIKELGYLGDPAHEPPNWYGVLDKVSNVVLLTVGVDVEHSLTESYYPTGFHGKPYQITRGSCTTVDAIEGHRD